MNVQILSLSQEVDLKDGATANLLTIELAPGVQIKALVSEEAVAKVIAVRHGVPVSQVAQPAPASAATAPTHPAPPPTDENGLFVFGGEEPEETAPPKPQKPKITRVDRDEYGYPIVRAKDAVDPSEISGGTNLDEDGFGQL